MKTNKIIIQIEMETKLKARYIVRTEGSGGKNVKDCLLPEKCTI